MAEDEKIISVGVVEYRVLRDRPDSALVFCRLEIEAAADCSMVASIDVDGIELLPSHRLVLARGKNEAELKPVRIINPLRTPYVMRLAIQRSHRDILFTDTRELVVE